MKLRLIQKSQGMTLLEIMLVLAVAAAIILLGMNQYQTYQKQQQLAGIRYNADFILQSMANYYQANCKNTGSGTSVLSPANITYPPTAPQEVTAALLAPYAGGTMNMSPLITAYTMQFNPQQFTKQMYTCNPYEPSAQKCSTPENIQTGTTPTQTVVIWQAQVAAEIANGTKILAQYYWGVTGADCVITTATDTTCPVFDDLPEDADHYYLVWRKLPAFASPNMSSDLGLFNADLKLFELQYSHDPFFERTSADYAAPTSQDYYYLCGG